MLKKKYLLIGILLFLPLLTRAEYCDPQKQRLTTLLQEGISRMRYQTEIISTSLFLTPELKHNVKTESDWVIAWTEDVIRRLMPEMEEKEEGIQCEEISGLISNVRAQWVPLELLMQMVRAEELRITFPQREDSSQNVIDAHILLDQLQDVRSFTESRVLLRKTIMLLRSSMRSTKEAAIISDT